VFEHCDPNTMIVVDTALQQARDFGHNYVGTEHLLLALVRHRDLLPTSVGALLPRAEDVESRLAAHMGAPARPHDAELLKLVGIDLEEVRASVRRTFGSDALDRLSRRRVHQPWQPWRRPSRRCTSLLAGSMSAAPRFKEAFERARRDSERRHREFIDPVTLLVGMIDVEDAMSNRLLRDTGVDPHVVRQVAREAA
jgi:ATP-dependent Clp protease ATP-binding subunit ClpA